MANHRLIFATGPTPPDPEHARTLGYEERKLSVLADENEGTFRMYVHRASLPELIAYARTLGRDCSFEVFADTQALLIVGGRDD